MSLLSIYCLISQRLHSGASNTGTPSNETYVPVSPVAGLITVSQDELKLCSDCRCCAVSDPSKCQQMKCCYQIKCREGKPSGQCSYKPIACDCNNCKWEDALLPPVQMGEMGKIERCLLLLFVSGSHVWLLCTLMLEHLVVCWWTII